MTLNFNTFTMSAQIILSDYNKQKIAYSPQFAATDYATLQVDAELTANLLSAITGLHFDSITIRKKYTRLHTPALDPAVTIESIGMLVCQLVAPPDDYFMLELPGPIPAIVNADQTINTAHPDVVNYTNVFRLNAYGNNRLLDESGGNTIVLASLRVPALKAIKNEPAIG
jgi:hypothetical protein